ncbi:hypothetical protein BH09PSE5_BH09PSE5_32130 [soil metagenome]
MKSTTLLARLAGRVPYGLRRRLPTLGMMAIGFGALDLAIRLPFGNIGQPDSGFFPVVVSSLFIVFCALSLLDPLKEAPTVGTDDIAGAAGPAEEPDGALRIWLTIGVLALYAAALNAVGFLVCTTALLVFLLRWIGDLAWGRSLAVAVLGSIGCYLAFTRLGLPLPPGVLPF